MCIRDRTKNVQTEGYKLNSDYVVSYSDNVEAGTAEVTIEGEGNYSGKKTYKFNILAKQTDEEDDPNNGVEEPSANNKTVVEEEDNNTAVENSSNSNSVAEETTTSTTIQMSDSQKSTTSNSIPDLGDKPLFVAFLAVLLLSFSLLVWNRLSTFRKPAGKHARR